MMTAMLALLGPIAVGRVRCIRVTPRLRNLVNSMVPMASDATMGAATAATASSSLALRAVSAWPPVAMRFFPRWHSSRRSLHRYVRIALAPLTHAGQMAVLAA